MGERKGTRIGAKKGKAKKKEEITRDTLRWSRRRDICIEINMVDNKTSNL